MKRPVWAWLALSSLAIAPLPGATRPHYGGSLTVELSGAWTSPDPGAWNTALAIPIAETLVRFDPRGGLEPALCVAWQHDADFKRWRFSLRPKVTFHDGEPLNGASAAPSLLAALKKKYPSVSIQAGGQAIVVQANEAMPDLLPDLAAPESALVRSSATIPLIGTGPFRVTAWEPGRRLVVAAFEDYWGSRPYLDSITVEMGSTRTRGDVFDIPVGPSRRILPEGLATWSSMPRSLVAIAAAKAPDGAAQALALVLDRAPIVNVLAQHKGDVAFGVLPQWLTGYAFLFQSSPDAQRARQMAAQLRLAPLTLSYPADDGFLRTVAERVALNARDAGIVIQPIPKAGGNLRLIEWQIQSSTPAAELARIASDLGGHVESNKPEALYEAERALLDRVIPLIHLRETYGIAPRVHLGISSADRFAIHLDDAWVSP